MQTMPIELQAARLQLLKKRPYLAALVWSLIPVQKPGLMTMAVDQYFRLYYDPKVVERWSVNELAGVLYHEANHLLRDHSGRLKDFDAQLANIAADLEINDDLAAEHIGLPGGALMPSTFGLPDGLLAEEYYAKLAKNPSPSSSGGTGQGQDGQGRGQGGQDGDGQGQDQGQNSQDQSGHGRSGQGHNGQGQDSQDNQDGQGRGQGGQADDQDDDQKPMPGAGSCGSCANGHRAPWEDDAPDGHGSSPDGITKAAAELIRREVAVRIAQASQTRGDIPDYLVRWANDKLSPKVNWRREIATAIRNAVAQVAGAVDYTYSKPSKRQGNSKIILPVLRQPVPDVAVVVDTSGSISDDMLSQALAEVSGVLKSCGSRGVSVLAVDADVHIAKKVFDVKQLTLAGGGGTDMGVGIQAAMKLKPRPHIIIVLTDGYTPWPDIPPKAKVIVGLLGDDADMSVPDWAKPVKISI
jgi:predicted metal-dependent peptidase